MYHQYPKRSTRFQFSAPENNGQETNQTSNEGKETNQTSEVAALEGEGTQGSPYQLTKGIIEAMKDKKKLEKGKYYKLDDDSAVETFEKMGFEICNYYYIKREGNSFYIMTEQEAEKKRKKEEKEYKEAEKKRKKEEKKRKKEEKKRKKEEEKKRTIQEKMLKKIYSNVIKGNPELKYFSILISVIPGSITEKIIINKQREDKNIFQWEKTNDKWLFFPATDKGEAKYKKTAENNTLDEEFLNENKIFI